MSKTVTVARERAFDQSVTVYPTEVARGVYMRNAPGLQALKLMHLMIATAGGRMADEVGHEIRLSDIRRVDGLNRHTRATLTPLFEELRAAVMTCDDPTEKKVAIGGLLDDAVIDYREEGAGELLVTFYFARRFRLMASASQHWAIIDRQAVYHLGSKYAVLLFQHVASLIGLRHVTSKTFSVAELRGVLGVPEGKVERFANLNRDALAPAIAEINRAARAGLSRFELSVEVEKRGRTVERVKIAWHVKAPAGEKGAGKPSKGASKAAALSVVPDAVTTAKPASAAPVAFPATGSIAYCDHWLAIKRAAGCNMDNAQIATQFRAFCRDKGLPLDGRQIEKVFGDYCRKVGRV